MIMHKRIVIDVDEIKDKILELEREQATTSTIYDEFSRNQGRLSALYNLIGEDGDDIKKNRELIHFTEKALRYRYSDKKIKEWLKIYKNLSRNDRTYIIRATFKFKDVKALIVKWKKEVMCELPEEKDLICGFKTLKGKKTCQKHLCIAYCYHKKLRFKGEVKL